MRLNYLFKYYYDSIILASILRHINFNIMSFGIILESNSYKTDIMHYETVMFFSSSNVD